VRTPNGSHGRPLLAQSGPSAFGRSTDHMQELVLHAAKKSE